jgi:hypothetical protein
MSWHDESHMARRGVAKGRPGQTHRLSEARQGPYHYKDLIITCTAPTPIPSFG